MALFSSGLGPDSISFDPRTEILSYPDGTKETLKDYQKRETRFAYIVSLQAALGRLKVLYQNPGCLTEAEYREAKQEIQEAFDSYEFSLFDEFGDDGV